MEEKQLYKKLARECIKDGNTLTQDQGSDKKTN
jgi:hypothetical protein